jgi:hypothetical protein
MRNIPMMTMEMVETSRLSRCKAQKDPVVADDRIELIRHWYLIWKTFIEPAMDIIGKNLGYYTLFLPKSRISLEKPICSLLW